MPHVLQICWILSLLTNCHLTGQFQFIDRINLILSDSVPLTPEPTHFSFTWRFVLVFELYQLGIQGSNAFRSIENNKDIRKRSRVCHSRHFAFSVFEILLKWHGQSCISHYKMHCKMQLWPWHFQKRRASDPVVNMNAVLVTLHPWPP